MRRPVARKFAVLAVTTAVVSVGAAAPPTPTADQPPHTAPTPVLRPRSRWPSVTAAPSPAWTPTPPPPASRCCARAATPSTRPWPPPPRSASLSPTRPASAEAATSSFTTPGPAPCTPSTAARRPRSPPTPASSWRTARPSRSPRRSPAGSPSAPRHARHLAVGARHLGQEEPGYGPQARRTARPRRLHRRRDLPRADRRQRDPLPVLPRHRRAVPPRRPTPRRRLHLQEPRPRPHLPRAEPQGRRRPVPGRHRPRHREHGQQAARGPGVRLERPPRRPVPARPRRLPHQAPGAHEDRIPRPRRLLHGALLLRRHDGRRGAQHSGAHRPVQGERRALPAPVHRGEPRRVRRPGPLGRRPRLRGRTDEGAALAAVRGLARLPDHG